MIKKKLICQECDKEIKDAPYLLPLKGKDWSANVFTCNNQCAVDYVNRALKLLKKYNDE